MVMQMSPQQYFRSNTVQIPTLQTDGTLPLPQDNNALYFTVTVIALVIVALAYFRSKSR